MQQRMNDYLRQQGLKWLRDERCPVCGKREVYLAGHAGDLPITLCMRCDNDRLLAERGWSKWRVRRLRAETHLIVWIANGAVGMALGSLAALCMLLLMATQMGEWARVAVGSVGTVAIFAVMLLYVIWRGDPPFWD